MPAYSTSISNYPPNGVLRSTLLNTHDKRKTLLLVPPSAKIMGFLCLSSHGTGATSKKVTILLWAHSSHSVGFHCRHPWGLYLLYLTTSPELIFFCISMQLCSLWVPRTKSEHCQLSLLLALLSQDRNSSFYIVTEVDC